MKLIAQTSLFVLCLFVVACSRPPAPEVPGIERVKFHEHVVQYPGETMGIIAEWYLGSPSKWHQLMAYNQHLDVHRIQIGSVIRIPRNLLTRNEPLPRPFVIQASQPTEYDYPSDTGDYYYPEA